MDELYPRLKSLTLLARQYDIGINIDAEEAVWRSPRSAGSCALNQSWRLERDRLRSGLQKRCPFVIDS
jgi:hypothetical protein